LLLLFLTWVWHLLPDLRTRTQERLALLSSLLVQQDPMMLGPSAKYDLIKLGLNGCSAVGSLCQARPYGVRSSKTISVGSYKTHQLWVLRQARHIKKQYSNLFFFSLFFFTGWRGNIIIILLLLLFLSLINSKEKIITIKEKL